ncbi:MAG TPA: cache domain-containing protein, partial [Candidatus Methylomirabilis sp.]|nr:cache domain-containing protein [Candidatus Methylomirabilis sp.]
MAKESGQKFFGKIGLKLTIPYFAISFFTLLVIGGFIYYQYQAGIRAAEQEEKSRAAAAAVEADSFFANIFSELQLLGKNITCPTCTVANDQELSNLIASNPDIYEISVIDVNGQELSKISQYNSSTTLENVSLQDKFKSALVSNSYLGPVHYSIYNLPLITVSYSLSDKSGDKIGVISGEIDLSKLWSSIFQNQLSQTGYFYVVDQSGSLIAAKDQDLVSQKPNLRESKGVSNFLNNDSTPAIYSSFNKQKVLGQWELIQSTGWGLLAEIPLKEILQNAWILWTVGGVSFLLFLLFMGAAFFLINKNLLSPLRSFASAVDEVKKGNYGYRINISSEDELGYLADIFNQTASQLRETHARLEDATKARTGELDKVIANLWKKNLQMKDEETAMTNLLEDARILQDQLTEEKDRISAIIAYMGEGLIATDKMGTINIVNPAAER